MFKQLVKVAAAITIAAIMQIGANKVAYMDRGYDAMGGEVMVFPLVLWTEYRVFLSEYDEEEWEEYDI